MKTASEGFKQRLRSGSTSLALLWTLTLPTGVVYRFTENTAPVFFGGEMYAVAPYIQISAIRDSVGAGYSDASISVTLDDDLISEGMIRYRELKNATFVLELIHADAIELGSMVVFAGTIGDSDTNNIDQATLSVIGGVGNSDSLVVGEVYSEKCRNVIGDNRCKVDLRKFEVPFVVTGVDTTTGDFYMSITPDENSFNAEITPVSEQQYGPGNWQFLIPANTTTLTVVVGGAGGAGARPSNAQAPGLPGADAGVTWFRSQGGGNPVAYGGKGGVRGRLPIDGGGEGSGAVLPGQGAAGGDVAGDDPAGRGGAGGRVVQTYEVGEGKALAVGQAITVQVAAGAPVDTTQPRGGDANLGATKGANGFVIVYTRGVVTTTDEGYNFGRVNWSEGGNSGRTHNIKSITNGRVTLNYNLFRPVRIGDRGIFTPGCSNYRSMCMGKYNNLPNMRAEPDVPQRRAVSPTVSSTAPDFDTSAQFTSPFYNDVSAGA